MDVDISIVKNEQGDSSNFDTPTHQQSYDFCYNVKPEIVNEEYNGVFFKTETPDVDDVVEQRFLPSTDSDEGTKTDDSDKEQGSKGEARGSKNKCAIPSCKNVRNWRKEPDLVFHAFPSEWQKQRRQQWLDAAQNPNITEENCLEYKICSIHFEPEYRAQGNRLTSNAIPTLLTSLPMETKRNKERAFFNYKEDDMLNAVRAVLENGLTKKMAARKFSVPRTTLIRRLTSKEPLARKAMPKPEVLTVSEEHDLVEWLTFMTQKGFPLYRNQLVLTVYEILTERMSDANIPGRSWFECFLKRHVSIKDKFVDSIGKAHAVVTQERIGTWFDDIMRYLRKSQLDDVLKDPSRIFSCDDVRFKVYPDGEKLTGPIKLSSEFYERSLTEKNHVSVMATFSADGKRAPTLIVYPFNKAPYETTNDNWTVSGSDTGCVNSDVFYSYVLNELVPYLELNKIVRPILFFLDGHRTHLSKRVAEYCDQEKIILLSFFPNTTKIMQPVYLSAFNLFKSTWLATVRIWKLDNFPADSTISNFNEIVKPAFDKFATPESIQNSFRKSGLYPFTKSHVAFFKRLTSRKISMTTECLEERLGMQRKLLSVLEDKIDKDELAEFTETYLNNADWTGNVESLNLYKVWSAIKSECAVQKDQSDPLNAVEQQPTDKEKDEEDEDEEDGEDDDEDDDVIFVEKHFLDINPASANLLDEGMEAKAAHAKYMREYRKTVRKKEEDRRKIIELQKRQEKCRSSFVSLDAPKRRRTKIMKSCRFTSSDLKAQKNREVHAAKVVENLLKVHQAAEKEVVHRTLGAQSVPGLRQYYNRKLEKKSVPWHQPEEP